MYEEPKLLVSDEEQAAFDKLALFFEANLSLVWGSYVTVEDWCLMAWHGSPPDNNVEGILEAVTKLLGIQVTVVELREFLRYDASKSVTEQWEKDTTVGAFAVWILDRCKLASMEPLQICGQTCRTAGIYLGMEELVRRTKQGTTHIGPSSKLLDVFKLDELGDFWLATRIACGCRMPAFRSFQNV